MIILNFNRLDCDDISELTHNQVMALYSVTLFEAYQQFQIDELDLSGSVPLLWAGRELRRIQKLLRSRKTGDLVFAPHSSSRRIIFKWIENQVLVTTFTISMGTESEHKSAAVSFPELDKAITKYARKIFKTIAQLWPPLREDQYRSWFFG